MGNKGGEAASGVLHLESSSEIPISRRIGKGTAKRYKDAEGARTSLIKKG